MTPDAKRKHSVFIDIAEQNEMDEISNQLPKTTQKLYHPFVIKVYFRNQKKLILILYLKNLNNYKKKLLKFLSLVKLKVLFLKLKLKLKSSKKHHLKNQLLEFFQLQKLKYYQ